MSATSELGEIPEALGHLSQDELVQLKELVDKKAWLRAATVEPLTKKETKAVTDAKRQNGPKAEKRVRDRFYVRHHWASLRWFLFGGLVDLPGLPINPNRAYDPEENPWVKIHVSGWTKTLDEHDEANPYKPLPDKDYLRLMSYAWVNEPLLLIPKSRQVLVTWLFCAIATHNLLVRPAQRMAVISKKFEDADALIDRMETIYNQLPHSRFHVPAAWPKHRKSGEVTCPENDSIVQAMGEEAKGLRQYTFSWVFSDEVAFQDQADEIFRAAMPTVKGGGRFTGVSTSNGEEVFHNTLSENGRIPTPAGA